MAKFSSFLIVLLLMLTSFTAGAQEYPRGDVNQDGAVNISDVTCLIDNLLKDVPEGDVDQDGSVNISDVTSLIDYLLSGSWPDDPVTPPDEGDWVDLGLPSGTIWATRNVGASAPEDYGDYFAWGETEPKSVYLSDNYKWWQEGHDEQGHWIYGYTKYCTISSNGYYYCSYCGTDGVVDNKTELDPEDDAACAHYPGGRMPSLEQIQALCNSCTWQRTQRNDVNGQLVTGPNGNTLFLPAAGHRFYVTLYHAGGNGFYLSRTLCSDYLNRPYCLDFSSDGWHDFNRAHGYSVRAVRVP